MTYINAIKYILSLPEAVSSTEDSSVIERMRSALTELGNPQKKLKCIHVCGDVGKDSCCRMVASILKYASYKVGCFSIPHGDGIRECITVNGKSISHGDLANITKNILRIYKAFSQNAAPSKGEIVTLIALIYFADNNCDTVILEKGYSRLDPANITDSPMISVITPFTEVLDNESIFEDIIHKGTAETVSCPQHKNIYNFISDACALSGCRLTVPTYGEMEIQKITLFKTFFKYRGVEYSVKSFSPCQTVNAITAVEIALSINRLGISISDDDIVKGIAQTNLDGKCETVSMDPTIILSTTYQPSRLDTLFASLAQVKDLLHQSVRIYADPEANIDLDRLSTQLASCGIRCKKASVFHAEADIASAKKMICELTHESELLSASLFIGSDAFISRVKTLIADTLGNQY